MQRGRDGEQDGSTADCNRSVAFDQFPLPANLNHPAIKFVSAAEMIAPLNKNQLRTSDVSASEISSDIVSIYSNESKTILLLDVWTGKTPA